MRDPKDVRAPRRREDLFPREHYKPYPELVAPEPGNYEIIDSRGLKGLPTIGMTDKEKRILWVPLDEAGRVVSLHELAHCRWSAERMPRVRFPLDVLRAVEDGRINRGLELIGMPLRLDTAQHEQVLALGKGDLEQGMAGMFVLRCVASFGTSIEADLRDVTTSRAPKMEIAHELVRKTRDKLERARRWERDVVCSFDRGVAIARWLAKQLEREGLELPERVEVHVTGCCMGSGGILVDAARPGRGRARGKKGGDPIEPGTMTLSEPLLSVPCAEPPIRARRARAAEEGVILRDIPRLFTDRKPFRRPVPKERNGGSVLVDVSGSMGFDVLDIEKIVAHSPSNTLVAIYSGRGDKGELRIVARGGLRASKEHLEPFGHGNIVDQPALEWLSRQAGPRVWISDGGVTGVGDSGDPVLKQRCRRICSKSDITQVGNAKEAAKELARRR